MEHRENPEAIICHPSMDDLADSRPTKPSNWHNMLVIFTNKEDSKFATWLVTQRN